MKCGIYKITNKNNQKIYVGKSIHIEQRWKEHISGKGNKELHNDIKKFGLTNFSFEIIELCSKEKLNEREKYWISILNSFHNGYNQNEGGDNNEQAVQKTRKEVFCYDLEGNFLKSYISLSEAERDTGIPNSNISKAARNEGRRKAGDYQWTYIKFNKINAYKRTCNFKKPPIHNSKTVLQYSLEGVFIAEFNSIKEAAEKTNTNYSSLGMACNGKRKTAGGFIWKFKEN